MWAEESTVEADLCTRLVRHVRLQADWPVTRLSCDAFDIIGRSLWADEFACDIYASSMWADELAGDIIARSMRADERRL